MKIAIIGYSGSGKSTLARHLGRQYGLDVLYLDKVYWLPGWRERPKAETQGMVEAFLDTHSAWVIDGNYTSFSFERRIAEADRILFLNFNRFRCLSRAVARHRAYRGRSRPSITEGCPEKMDWEFFWWILCRGRTARQSPAWPRLPPPLSRSSTPGRRADWTAHSRTARQRAVFRSLSACYPGKVMEIRNQRALDRVYRGEGLEVAPPGRGERETR